MRMAEQSRGEASQVDPPGLRDAADPPPRERAPATRRPLPLLEANTRLVRTWRDVRHEVVVLEGGRTFRYRNRTYDNLSEIARAITGARWSGPRFFGLRTRGRTGGGAGE